MKAILITLSLFLGFAASAKAAPQAGRYFDRAIIVIFENTNYTAALQQPFFKQLAAQGASFSNFMSVIHPSQGNYVALTSGDLNGVTNDTIQDIDAANIVDLLEAKGISWKAYVEDYPGNCFTGASRGFYYRKHNPFISYLDIQKNSARCANIVNAAEFDRDVQNGNLPSYVFYVPNIKNDGHDTGVRYADHWYSSKFSALLNDPNFMQGSVLISTFDESGSGSRNQIYTSIVGPNVRAGLYADPVGIPSLLRLIEDNWDLGSLNGKDTTANPLPDIWLN